MRGRLILLAAVFLAGCTHEMNAQIPRVRVVTHTEGFRHDSIETAERVLQEIADERGYSIDFVRNAADVRRMMAPGALNGVRVVVFANTTGDLPLPDRDAFVNWVAAGRGFVAVHSAADTFHGFPPYLDMLGGEFDTHGDQVTVLLRIDDSSHPATQHVQSPVSIFDEIYIFKRFDPSRVNLLISLDRHPNNGTPGLFPISWFRAHGRGRVFYTALGHRQDVWELPWYREHVANAIDWAAEATTEPRNRPARVPR
jgi:type 1 glutamine amidotransferase